jgi:hypothetical protein
VTARLIPGTQAQNVIGVADELQDLPPASTDALAPALAVAVDPDDEDDPDDAELLPLLLQAASIKMAADPAAAAVILRGFDNILARLLCSVLPYLCAVAALLTWPPAASGPRSRGVRSAATTCAATWWSSSPR